jgi:solute:Na+ symporter, SSS family
MNKLVTLDYIVFVIYFIVVASYGYYVYTRKRTATTDSKDFFLAEGSLTWWAIGASLIASNISAEHFIGMSGSGFALGLAISTYEWMAAATLIIVAVFFIPIYLKNKIYTMPQFLSMRYNDTVSTIMAIFWLLIYVFVNLTSIIYLGAIAINSLTAISFGWCVAGLIFLRHRDTWGHESNRLHRCNPSSCVNGWRFGDHLSCPYHVVGTVWIWTRCFQGVVFTEGKSGFPFSHDF